MIGRLTPASRPRLRTVLAPVIAFVVIMLLWEEVIKQAQLPPPSQIVSALAASHERLTDDAVATFWEEALRGYLIGCGLAFLFAAVCVRLPFLRRGLMPYAVVSNSIPIIAFAPVVIFWFGFGWQSKAIVVVLLTFFPMLVNTVAGLTSYDPLSRELMRSYAAGNWSVFWKLQLPNALPYIFNGLKICTTLSMIGAVIAEYFPGPNRGLGFEILNEANQAAWDQVWAGVTLACAIGIAFYVIVLLLERSLTFWHVSYRTRR
jgi:NitT/TauT family transport system permease protein